MLREIEGLRQDASGLQRRWFHDDYFDLFVWQRDDGALATFELCYGADASECALVWRDGEGFYHDGPSPADNAPEDAGPICERFKASGAELPDTLRRELEERLAEYLATRDRLTTRRKRFRRADWQQARESR